MVTSLNSNAAVAPLYQLKRSEWWMHAVNGCAQDEPAEGAVLELPAGGSFTVEMAHNRAFTTLSYDGNKTTEWPDGSTSAPQSQGSEGCVDEGALHTVGVIGPLALLPSKAHDLLVLF